jgi:hypothetical protein
LKDPNLYFDAYVHNGQHVMHPDFRNRKPLI